MQNKEEKQAYLRQYILEPGYDPAQFVDFLNTKLPIGDNLDLCNFQQLQAVVKQYLAFKKQEDQHSFEPLVEMQQSAIQLPQESIAYKTKPLLFTNYMPHMLEPEYSKFFQCKKIIDKYNHLKTIKCLVSNPQRKNTDGFFGLGATSFLQFRVQTLQLNWKVGRRYSDFIWLREYLRKIYPTYIIPPIPQKKASKRTQRHIQKRMKILEYFLNDLVSIRQMLNDPCVEGFLNMTDHVKFQNLKKQSGKIKPFSAISDCQNIEGKVSSRLCEENKVFLEQMQKKTPQMQKLYKSITRGGKCLQQQITAEVNTLYEIGNHFADLHQIVKDISNKIPKAQPLKSLNQIYITLNNMMIQWGNLLRNQHQLLQTNFNTFFKYLRNQLYGFTEITMKEQELQIEYNKFKVALEKKKEKIYSAHDPQKWDLPSKELKTLSKELIHDKSQAFKVMLPKENAALQKMRTNLFLYIEQLYQNGLINFQRNTDRYCDNFKQFAIKVKVNNQQLGEMWMEMSANFSGPNQKPQILKIKPEVQIMQEYDDF